MDLLETIKHRNTIRKYKDTPIPDQAIQEIVEAGRWASSVHGFQPWKFVVVTNTPLIKEISNIILRKAEEVGLGINKLLSFTANTITNSALIILVYNENSFRDTISRFFKVSTLQKRNEYLRIAEKTEVEAISGAIQNMILTANNLGIGSCWNTIPLFCEQEINNLLDNNSQLVAVLTFGYPDEKGKRSKRKKTDDLVKYME